MFYQFVDDIKDWCDSNNKLGLKEIKYKFSKNNETHKGHIKCDIPNYMNYAFCLDVHEDINRVTFQLSNPSHTLVTLNFDKHADLPSQPLYRIQALQLNRDITYTLIQLTDYTEFPSFNIHISYEYTYNWFFRQVKTDRTDLNIEYFGESVDKFFEDNTYKSFKENDFISIVQLNKELVVIEKRLVNDRKQYIITINDNNVIYTYQSACGLHDEAYSRIKTIKEALFICTTDL